MMKFKAIEFKEDSCQKIYNDYIKSVKKATKLLDREESQEILMEFNSHIYENMQRNSSKTEQEKLSMAIAKLGNPQEVLKPLIADRLLEKATKTFNPIDVLRALALNITNGISYVVFSLLYLLLGGFVFLIFAKLFNNDNVGLFIEDGKFRIFGMTSNANNYQEILGYWFIPLMLLLIIILYFLITLLLKIKKSFSPKVKIQKASIFIIFLFSCQLMFAQNTVITPEKKEEIQNYINHFEKNDQLMGSVSIFQNGKSVLDINWGKKNSSIEKSQTTKYTIGSITKLFVGILFAQLEEKGEIKYTEKLSVYFPNIPNADKIEIGQMLNHTSGLKNYTSKSDSLHFWLTKPRTKQDIMNEIIHQGVAFEPKEKVRYSNTAYYLLARILEQKHKQSFKHIVSKEFTVPLGLKNTFSIDETSFCKNIAKSYEKKNGKWGELDEFYFPNVSGVGDIISTAYDMNIFLSDLFSNKIIKKETLNKMLPQGKSPFGLGIMKIPFYEHIIYGHGGDTYGTHSLAIYDPKNNIAITYIINGENYPAKRFGIGLFSIVYDKEYKLPEFKIYFADKRYFELYEGVYTSKKTAITLKFYREDGTLKAKANGQEPFSLTPIEKHIFEFAKAKIKVEFRPNENKLIFTQGGQQYEFQKR